MMKTRKTRGFTGTTDFAERSYEIKHRNTSRNAATEGFVMLKNEKQILPLNRDKQISLYGAGAGVTVKGGTGSGDVNERNVISIYQGLINAGYIITTEEWISDYNTIYEKRRLNWRQAIWNRAKDGNPYELFKAYSETPFQIPAGKIPEKTEVDVAMYVLSRNAGEGADRHIQEGDYYLSMEERDILDKICHSYKQVILILNVGGIVDLGFLEEYENINAVLLVSQPGMEAGNALADVVSGKITPSGKLTDTWAYKYEDYPNAGIYSHNDGNLKEEIYEEGIFVGYRYFDKIQKPVRYGFGFGLSYTAFDISMICIEKIELQIGTPKILLKAKVKNTGTVYSGKEVVQIYVACPQTQIDKEERRLVAFHKTRLLKPGEEEMLEIYISLSYFTSYSEKVAGWILDEGIYGIFLGNSLQESKPVACVKILQNTIFEKTKHICVPNQEIEEIDISKNNTTGRKQEWNNLFLNCPLIEFDNKEIISKTIQYSLSDKNIESNILEFVDSLTIEQLILLATGKTGGDQESNLGAAGQTVPGAAGETSSCAEKQGLASIVMADGPAGLRLAKNYYVKDNKIVPVPFEMGLEGGFLCKKTEVEGEKWNQYCTAMPVGTLLAQTWNTDIIEEVGKAVAEEMQMFHITLWLAPGMNIHRNPLCGRNFEYYSEDPVLSGKIAAAMTRGVQSEYGCGTTVKHFACNNAEDNRMESNSILSERTLREIYLKGFEIVIKEAQPFSIMTSYNKINGIHSANNYDLCTNLLRNEWNFKGVVMTDWATTQQGMECTAAGCMRAGNDLVMPGTEMDHENIRQALENGKLSLTDLKKCIAHIVSIVWKSNAYEGTC